jgi:hypothetical protein
MPRQHASRPLRVKEFYLGAALQPHGRCYSPKSRGGAFMPFVGPAAPRGLTFLAVERRALAVRAALSTRTAPLNKEASCSAADFFASPSSGA